MRHAAGTWCTGVWARSWSKSQVIGLMKQDSGRMESGPNSEWFRAGYRQDRESALVLLGQGQ